ncbi:MAG: ATP-binding cassette domain-containing protein [Planctomycetes bacterium]|nr:ATP-binding cassette domain-containing protein [Planctomycetota bacterium]
MSLRLDVQVRRGPLQLAIELEVGARETVAIVGPNGAGKSSLLLAVAGLLPLERGRIALADEVLDGGAGGPFVPPEARRAGMMFQDLLLFPHLAAIDNVAYGLRARGVGRAVARATADEWLRRVGLAEHGAALPGSLSGGQAQRVALARALAASPRLLLLDEPLAAVDASTRLRLRRDLRAHLDAFAGPRLLVTHDAVDAFALADRIAVVEAGRVVQAGSIAEICSRPRSRYVADLVGLNFLRGICRGGRLQVDGGGTLIVSQAPEGNVLATVHPRAIALYRSRPDGTPRNVWPAAIEALEVAGDRVRVRLRGEPWLVAEVTPLAVAELQLGIGGTVWVALKATEVEVFAA